MAVRSKESGAILRIDFVRDLTWNHLVIIDFLKIPIFPAKI
jgi:hypothetical protein